MISELRLKNHQNNDYKRKNIHFSKYEKNRVIIASCIKYSEFMCKTPQQLVVNFKPLFSEASKATDR